MKNNSLQARQKRLKKILRKRRDAEYKRVFIDEQYEMMMDYQQDSHCQFKRMMDNKDAIMMDYQQDIH